MRWFGTGRTGQKLLRSRRLDHGCLLGGGVARKGPASGSGWQGGTDESWAIDNLAIIANADGQEPGIPEPATLTFFGVGLLGLGYVRRRRRKTG